jgi:hypothetical protein
MGHRFGGFGERERERERERRALVTIVWLDSMADDSNSNNLVKRIWCA